MKNLYMVTLFGDDGIFGQYHKVNYCIEENPEKAYQKVKKYLEERDFGNDISRRLESVVLLAEGEGLGKGLPKLYI